MKRADDESPQRQRKRTSRQRRPQRRQQHKQRRPQARPPPPTRPGRRGTLRVRIAKNTTWNQARQEKSASERAARTRLPSQGFEERSVCGVNLRSSTTQTIRLTMCQGSHRTQNSQRAVTLCSPCGRKPVVVVVKKRGLESVSVNGQHRSNHHCPNRAKRGCALVEAAAQEREDPSQWKQVAPKARAWTSCAQSGLEGDPCARLRRQQTCTKRRTVQARRSTWV